MSTGNTAEKKGSSCRTTTGPMMSGKTGALKHRVLQFVLRKQHVVIVRSVRDHRWQETAAPASSTGGCTALLRETPRKPEQADHKDVTVPAASTLERELSNRVSTVSAASTLEQELSNRVSTVSAASTLERELSTVPAASTLERELSNRVSHDGSRYLPEDYIEEGKKYVTVVRCLHLEELKTREDLLLIPHWVVDELHFFDDNPPSYTGTGSSGGEFLKWLRMNHHVFTYGLNLDWKRIHFRIQMEVETFADERPFHSAICMRCGQTAGFTRRLQSTKQTPRLQVGGSETYEARCFLCFEL